MGDSRSNRSRIVVDASPRQRRPPARGYRQPPRNTEVWLAISLIVAGAVATFLCGRIYNRAGVRTLVVPGLLCLAISSWGSPDRTSNADEAPSTQGYRRLLHG